MVRSRPVAERRILLQGLDCRVWYLGERIHGWKADGRARRVPLPPPRGIFHGHLLRGEALAAALRGTDAEGLYDMSRRRYLDFARTQLLQRVSPAASPPQTAAGGSPTQVSLLFWLIFIAFLRIPTDLIFTITFHPQVPARAPVRPRPRALERPQQRPQIAPTGEGTSAGVSQGTAAPSSSGSDSRAVLGRLGCPPNMMVRCWTPPGELSRRFVQLDDSL